MTQEAQTETRYCVGCRWFRPDVSPTRRPGSRASIEFGKCAAKLAPRASDNRYLAPEFDGEAYYASCMRGNPNRCGPEAKWFEPKLDTPVSEEAA